jgi:hypothetical protein
VFVPSEAVTVKLEVVSDPTAFAVPENVPFELNVNPPGIDPEVTEKVMLSPSSSEAATVVKFDAALSKSNKVPSEPAATLKAGAASILKAAPKFAVNPLAEVNLTP